LAPALRGDRPSNVFIYGKTGTGKTAVAQYVCSELKRTALELKKKVDIIYVNCKLAGSCDTEYRLIANLTRELGQHVPATGLPINNIYQKFFDSLEERGSILIVMLDEIDFLVKKIGDGFIYSLTRINEELRRSQICFIGITNDLALIGGLDPRVRSSLSEEEILFTPYNAVQLCDILAERANKAFMKNALSSGVIEKCAALAAQEHGDARRAIDLLRVAGEIAERMEDKQIRPSHVDLAHAQIDQDKVLQAVEAQPKQSQAVLFSIIALKEKNGGEIQSGEIFSFYKKICQKAGLRILTNRRVFDLIAELETFGIINTRVVSNGRYGRTTKVSLPLDKTILNRVKLLLRDFDEPD
jgi:cell division control protein 6